MYQVVNLIRVSCRTEAGGNGWPGSLLLPAPMWFDQRQKQIVAARVVRQFLITFRLRPWALKV